MPYKYIYGFLVLLACTIIGSSGCSKEPSKKTVTPQPRNINPSWLSITQTTFPIGIWFDGFVEGISLAAGCTDVPAGETAARNYYTQTFTQIKNTKHNK